jgi:hypothetical protein
MMTVNISYPVDPKISRVRRCVGEINHDGRQDHQGPENLLGYRHFRQVLKFRGKFHTSKGAMSTWRWGDDALVTMQGCPYVKGDMNNYNFILAAAIYFILVPRR